MPRLKKSVKIACRKDLLLGKIHNFCLFSVDSGNFNFQNEVLSSQNIKPLQALSGILQTKREKRDVGPLWGHLLACN
jgi:hypothetical protein